MSCFKFDQKENLVTLSNSLLKHFTNIIINETSAQMDAILNKSPYNKICVLLFDGLGKSIKDLHLSKNDFLRKKEKFTITSIFPPTTVAATTAFLSCRYPCETGWLGWQQYFFQHDLVVEMFTNCNAKDHTKIKGTYLSNMYCSYTSIIELINEKSDTFACSLYPSSIDSKGAKDLKDFFKKAEEIVQKHQKLFSYMYWTEPDSLIHEYGTDNCIIKDAVKRINQGVQKLAKNNKDTLFIILADHSLVDTKFFYVFEHEDFASCLKTITSLDSRSCFFHVKFDKINIFKNLFKKYYGDYFILKSKKEVIEEGWFGNKKVHPLFEEFFGDYMATSISDYGFSNTMEAPFIGAHAGSLKEESEIGVSIINI